MPAAGFEGLDTDAAATPGGVVYYDAGRPMLLDLDGEIHPWSPDAVDRSAATSTRRPRPTRPRPRSPWPSLRDGEPRILVVDTETGRCVDAIDFVCDGLRRRDRCVRRRCGVLPRRRRHQRCGTSTGTSPAPSPGRGRRSPTSATASCSTTAPCRSPSRASASATTPSSAGRSTPSSPTTVPTCSPGRAPWSRPGRGEPLQLSVTERDSASQWTVDTDGSILVASRAGSATRVDDCDPVTGACERVDVARGDRRRPGVPRQRHVTSGHFLCAGYAERALPGSWVRRAGDSWRLGTPSGRFLAAGYAERALPGALGAPSGHFLAVG